MSLFALDSMAKTRINFQITSPKTIRHSFKEVCSSLSGSHALLPKKESLHILNCMGQKIKAKDFCFGQHRAQKNFLRGVVDESSETIICQFGEAAYLSYQCIENEKACLDSKKQCQIFKANYAHGLTISSHAVVDNSKITCQFVASSPIKTH